MTFPLFPTAGLFRRITYHILTCVMASIEHTCAALQTVCKTQLLLAASLMQERAHVAVGAAWFRRVCDALDLRPDATFRAWLSALCPDLLKVCVVCGNVREPGCVLCVEMCGSQGNLDHQQWDLALLLWRLSLQQRMLWVSASPI